jgi:hypothetical protein
MAKQLINRRLARALFLESAREWGRPLTRPPVGFQRELEVFLRAKIATEAMHPGNQKGPTN